MEVEDEEVESLDDCLAPLSCPDLLSRQSPLNVVDTTNVYSLQSEPSLHVWLRPKYFADDDECPEIKLQQLKN